VNGVVFIVGLFKVHVFLSEVRDSLVCLQSGQIFRNLHSVSSEYAALFEKSGHVRLL